MISVPLVLFHLIVIREGSICGISWRRSKALRIISVRVSLSFLLKILPTLLCFELFFLNFLSPLVTGLSAVTLEKRLLQFLSCLFTDALSFPNLWSGGVDISVTAAGRLWERVTVAVPGSQRLLDWRGLCWREEDFIIIFRIIAGLRRGGRGFSGCVSDFVSCNRGTEFFLRFVEFLSLWEAFAVA